VADLAHGEDAPGVVLRHQSLLEVEVVLPAGVFVAPLFHVGPVLGEEGVTELDQARVVAILERAQLH
jgi:hypothetical protein